jgi:hypothetical protein
MATPAEILRRLRQASGGNPMRARAIEADGSGRVLSGLEARQRAAEGLGTATAAADSSSAAVRQAAMGGQPAPVRSSADAMNPARRRAAEIAARVEEIEQSILGRLDVSTDADGVLGVNELAFEQVRDALAGLARSADPVDQAVVAALARQSGLSGGSAETLAEGIAQNFAIERMRIAELPEATIRNTGTERIAENPFPERGPSAAGAPEAIEYFVPVQVEVPVPGGQTVVDAFGRPKLDAFTGTPIPRRDPDGLQTFAPPTTRRVIRPARRLVADDGSVSLEPIGELEVTVVGRRRRGADGNQSPEQVSYVVNRGDGRYQIADPDDEAVSGYSFRIVDEPSLGVYIADNKFERLSGPSLPDFTAGPTRDSAGALGQALLSIARKETPTTVDNLRRIVSEIQGLQRYSSNALYQSALESLGVGSAERGQSLLDQATARLRDLDDAPGMQSSSAGLPPIFTPGVRSSSATPDIVEASGSARPVSTSTAAASGAPFLARQRQRRVVANQGPSTTVEVDGPGVATADVAGPSGGMATSSSISTNQGVPDIFATGPDPGPVVAGPGATFSADASGGIDPRFTTQSFGGEFGNAIPETATDPALLDGLRSYSTTASPVLNFTTEPGSYSADYVRRLLQGQDSPGSGSVDVQAVTPDELGAATRDRMDYENRLQAVGAMAREFSGEGASDIGDIFRRMDVVSASDPAFRSLPVEEQFELARMSGDELSALRDDLLRDEASFPNPADLSSSSRDVLGPAARTSIEASTGSGLAGDGMSSPFAPAPTPERAFPTGDRSSSSVAFGLGDGTPNADATIAALRERIRSGSPEVAAEARESLRLIQESRQRTAAANEAEAARVAASPDNLTPEAAEALQSRAGREQAEREATAKFLAGQRQNIPQPNAMNIDQAQAAVREALGLEPGDTLPLAFRDYDGRFGRRVSKQDVQDYQDLVTERRVTERMTDEQYAAARSRDLARTARAAAAGKRADPPLPATRQQRIAELNDAIEAKANQINVPEEMLRDPTGENQARLVSQLFSDNMQLQVAALDELFTGGVGANRRDGLTNLLRIANTEQYGGSVARVIEDVLLRDKSLNDMAQSGGRALTEDGLSVGASPVLGPESLRAASEHLAQVADYAGSRTIGPEARPVPLDQPEQPGIFKRIRDFFQTSRRSSEPTPEPGQPEVTRGGLEGLDEQIARANDDELDALTTRISDIRDRVRAAATADDLVVTNDDGTVSPAKDTAIQRANELLTQIRVRRQVLENMRDKGNADLSVSDVRERPAGTSQFDDDLPADPDIETPLPAGRRGPVDDDAPQPGDEEVLDSALEQARERAPAGDDRYVDNRSKQAAELARRAQAARDTERAMRPTGGLRGDRATGAAVDAPIVGDGTYIPASRLQLAYDEAVRRKNVKDGAWSDSEGQRLQRRLEGSPETFDNPSGVDVVLDAESGQQLASALSGRQRTIAQLQRELDDLLAEGRSGDSESATYDGSRREGRVQELRSAIREARNTKPVVTRKGRTEQAAVQFNELVVPGRLAEGTPPPGSYVLRFENGEPVVRQEGFTDTRATSTTGETPKPFDDRELPIIGRTAQEASASPAPAPEAPEPKARPGSAGRRRRARKDKNVREYRYDDAESPEDYAGGADEARIAADIDEAALAEPTPGPGRAAAERRLKEREEAAARQREELAESGNAGASSAARAGLGMAVLAGGALALSGGSSGSASGGLVLPGPESGSGDTNNSGAALAERVRAARKPNYAPFSLLRRY